MALIVPHGDPDAIVTGITLPLTFLSTASVQKSLMPEWMRVVADANPVNWAIEAGREACLVGHRLGLRRLAPRSPRAGAPVRRLRDPRVPAYQRSI